MSINYQMHFTNLEKASLTKEFLQELNRWDHDKKHPLSGNFGARVVGFFATPFTSLIDAFAHSFLFLGKSLSGFFVSPYNLAAKAINPIYMAPKDLELSSALIHLCRLLESLFKACTLPFIMLLNPGKGFLLSQEAGKESRVLLKSFSCCKRNAELLEEVQEKIQLQDKQLAKLQVLLSNAYKKLDVVLL